MTSTIFVGQICPLPPSNRPTGMFKAEITGTVPLGPCGLSGDEQADRRVHGGPEKALHLYPQIHYATLASRFPDAATALVLGAMGENISAPGWDEAQVSIGDVFRLGSALIQISQPRSPCWKIDDRFSVEGMAQFIAEQRITGWYFRVLEPGEVAPGADLLRLERPNASLSLADFLALWAEHRPEPERLLSLADLPGLSPNWVNKLQDRAQRLKELGLARKEA